MRGWLVLILVLLAFLVGFLYVKMRSKPQPSHLTKIEHRKKVKPIRYYVRKLGTDKLTLLLLGVDITWTREHLPTTKRSRSDTIMIVRFDLPHRYVGVLSIPRDLKVKLPPPYGYYTKINACTALEGPRLLEKVLRDELDIYVDNVVVVKQEAIKELIDAIGGLEVDVEKDMDYDDNWGNFHVHLKKGPQTLNGEQVVGYIRFRYDPEGDLGRIRRQHQVLMELAKQLPDKLKGVNAVKLVYRVRPYIRTDMDLERLLTLLSYLKDYGKSLKVRMGTVPVIDEYDYEGGIKVSYLKLKSKEEYWETVKYILKGYPSLELLNGTDISGLAHNLYERYLKDYSVAVMYIGNAPRDDVKTTLILYGREDLAEELYYRLGFGRMEPVDRYLYERLYDTSGQLYLSDKFLWRYLKDELRPQDYDVGIVVGEDYSALLEGGR